MKSRLIASLLALSLAQTLVCAATAETLPKPDNFVFWPTDQIPAGYRHMAKIFRTDTVRKGRQVRPLPAGDRLDVSYEQDGKLKTTDDFMRENNVAGLIVLHHGKIVLERYGLGQTAKDSWTSNSVAKSFTSTLIGAAIKDGAISSVDDPMSKYIPELASGSFAGVTIRQTLNMASGVKWVEDYQDRNANSSQIRNLDYAGSTAPSVDIVAYMSSLPREAEPGAKFVYDSGNPHLLGVLLERATGKSLPAYLSEKIWIPAGMEADATMIRDRSGRPMGSCCLNARLRDFARFGLFFMGGGKSLDGRSILPSDWVAQASHPALPTRSPGVYYGYQWWVEPNGAYRAVGIFGQMIRVSPKNDLVIVTLSAWPRADWRPGYANQTAYIAGVEKAIASR